MMKKIQTLLGYLTSMLLLATIAFKVNRYPGEEFVMAITGIFISVYFPIYILVQGKIKHNGKSVAIDYVLALTVFFVALGATLKLSHLELGSLIILLGFASFCLVYLPLLFINKLKETGSNKLMYLAGVIGLTSFPLGIFLRVYLGSEYGMQMFSVGAVLIALIFLPIYIFDKSLSDNEKQKRATNTFYRLIIGFLLFFCLFKSVYPPKIDIQNADKNQLNKMDH